MNGLFNPAKWYEFGTIRHKILIVEVLFSTAIYI
jgi:hypothetical protein